jgi:hypothetical protein
METTQLVTEEQGMGLRTPSVLQLSLVIRDPEVVAECMKHAEGELRHRYAVGALRIGVLALRQASGEVDADKIQREADRLLSNLGDLLSSKTQAFQVELSNALQRYFDPESGRLPQRLEKLVSDGGELDSLLQNHLGVDTSTIARTLSQHLGADSPLFRLLSPNQREGLQASLTSSIDALLKDHRTRILNEFSLDSRESALSRFLSEVTDANGKLRKDLEEDFTQVRREFSLDNEEGALSRLVGRVEKVQDNIAAQFSNDNQDSAISRMSRILESTQGEIQRRLTLDDATSPLCILRRELMEVVQALNTSNASFQAEVRDALVKLTARREEASRTTTHGSDFQDEVGKILAREAQKAGDIYEDTATRVGLIPNCKVGDHLITLGPDSAAPGACIAVETKASKSYSLAKALEEMDTARRNRGAQIGIFIFSRESAPAEIQDLARYGSDIVVVWDETEPTSDALLRAALSMARALTIRISSANAEEAISLEAIDRAVNIVNKEIDSLSEIIATAGTIEKGGEKIRKRAELISQRVHEQIQVLDSQVHKLKHEPNPGFQESR